jgi:hypothetical protein
MARVADLTMPSIDDFRAGAACLVALGATGLDFCTFATDTLLAGLDTPFFCSGFGAALAAAFLATVTNADLALLVAFAVTLTIGTAAFLLDATAGLGNLPVTFAPVTLGFAVTTVLATGFFADGLASLAAVFPGADLTLVATDFAAPAFSGFLTGPALDTAGVLALALVLIAADFADPTTALPLTGFAVFTLDLLATLDDFDFAATLSPSLLDCLSHGGRVLYAYMPSRSKLKFFSRPTTHLYRYPYALAMT